MNAVHSAYWLAYRAALTDATAVRATSNYLRYGQDCNADRAAAETYAALCASIRGRDANGTLPDVMLPLTEAKTFGALESAWRQVPILTREGLNRTARPPRKRGDVALRTGGSTGEPVSLVLSRDGFRRKRSRLISARQAIGWQPGMPTFAVWGSERDIGKPDRLKTRLHQRASNLRMNGGFNANEGRWIALAKEIRRQPKQVALYGYSSLLHDFASTLLRRDCVLPPGLVGTIWNGAEGISTLQREALMSATGADVHDFYGAREIGAIAVEIEPQGGQGLTSVGPDVIVEIVDSRGHPVSSGETGRVVVSSLGISGTPLYRYEIGDLAVAGAEYAFGHLAITELIGRSNEGVPLPGGGVVRGLFFNHAVKDFPWVRQFQCLVNVDGHRADLRVLLNHEPSTLEKNALVQVLGRGLAGYDVTITPVRELARTREGKLCQVILQ